jgi:hypothetical protein
VTAGWKGSGCVRCTRARTKPEGLGAVPRPGNAGSNTAADHQTVFGLALAQIPGEQIESSNPGRVAGTCEQRRDRAA